MQLPASRVQSKLGLDATRPVYVWQLRMVDPRRAKEWPAAPAQCFEKLYLGRQRVEGGTLKVEVEARPLLLELLVLTQVPVWLTDVAGENLRTVQSNILTAAIQAGGPGKPLSVTVERSPATLFALSEEGRAPSVVIDGSPCPTRPAKLGNAEGAAFDVPAGKHTASVAAGGA